MTLTRHSFAAITDLDAGALSRAIHAKQLSCREVMQAYLERIGRLNPRHNAIVSLQDGDLLLRQADERDAQLARGESMGWLHGIPQAIKDMAHVAGMRTTLGSPLMRDFVSPADGVLAQRMKAAGCIVIGKTNTPEFGLGSHTFNEVFGITRNAYDPAVSAGGSSGGAAVALALRLLPVADGSDFMGSLRNPGGWNNVFGMRPSQGRVPQGPAQDVWTSQLSTAGPMGRSVTDLARMLEVQAGYHVGDPLSLDEKPQFNLEGQPLDTKSVRVGWLRDLDGYLPIESGVIDVCEQALRRMEGMGCAIEPASLGTPPQTVWHTWLLWRRALAATRIAPFLIEKPENRALIKPEALWEYDQAQQLTGPQFMAASVARTAFYQHMVSLFGKYDALALPVAQVWPFPAEQRWPTHIHGVEMDTYHRWMEVVIYATLAGLPAISVPAGFDARGLPMGLQLIGKPRGDLALLKLAQAYEQAAQEVLARRPGAA